MQRRRICTCWRRLNPVISAGSSTSVGSCTPSVSTGEHPQTVRESLPDLTVNPVGRGVDQPLTNLISEGQPVWPDNHQQHATGPQPTQQDLNEIRPHRDRPRVQNTRSFPKRCRQLPVDQGCAGQAVLTPIVDEHPTHRIIPSSPPSTQRSHSPWDSIGRERAGCPHAHHPVSRAHRLPCRPPPVM